MGSPGDEVLKTVLVINLGMKSVRSILFREDGAKLATVSEAVETSLTDDYVTQDPTDWWRLAKATVKECLKTTGVTHIDYITVTASAACLVCVDAKGNPLLDSMMVSDKRAIDEAELLSRHPDFGPVRAATGLGADASLMLPKLLWVLRNRPEVFADTFKVLSPNDYFIGKLTGRYVTDYLNAEKLHFDRTTGRYPTDLLAALGIPEQLLPEVVAPGTAVGPIRSKLAKEWGINDDAQVVVTSYDAICSFFGSGSSSEGDASDASGTVTTLRAFTKKRDLVSSPKVFHQPIPELDTTLVGGSNNLGGGLIEWLRQCYYQNEPYAYELMEQEASESTIGANGLVFLPYLLGERMPLWDPNVRGLLFGLERSHKRGDVARAVFESVGFVLKDMLLAIEETGVQVENIYLSGGLTRVGLISRLKADITGRNIVVADEFETTALGAAIMVLTSQGVFVSVSDAAESLLTASTMIRPAPKRAQQYDRIYEFYKRLYEDTQDLFIERKKVFGTGLSDNLKRIHNL